MKKILQKILLGFTLFASAILYANKPKTAFAVVIDSYTASHLQNELDLYKKSLENDGLQVFILSEDWKSPEDIKNKLHDLYLNNRLEGAVFIGNIPVPMIRDAQHLTSTFKMPQTMDWVESSVPSDRYYDDFDLKWNFIKQDENHQNLFYYQLDAESPQYIEMDIYSGRLKPPTANKEESINYIRKYLNKIIAQRQVNNPFDNVTAYTAEGYNSNSLNSWSSVLIGFKNQFASVFNAPNQIKFAYYDNQSFMKGYWLTQLRRKDVDYAYFNGHGLPDYQIVSGNLEGSSPSVSMENVSKYVREHLRSAKKKNKNIEETTLHLQKTLGLNDKWFSDAFDPEMIIRDSIFDEQKTISLKDIKDWEINAKFVYLDACLNGSFQLEDYIAGYYPFSNGDNLVTIANSVGVLQDLWANEMMGLIQNGTRIGQVLKHSAYLETHIFGDPSFHFSAANSNQWNENVAHNNSVTFWRKQLHNGLPDVQALALRKLFQIEDKSKVTPLITAQFYQNTNEVVRTEAYLLLRKLKPEDWHQIIIAASKDNFEYLRRTATYDIAESGDPIFLEPLINLYLEDRHSNRTQFNVERTLDLFERDLVVATIASQAKQHPVYDKTMINDLMEKYKKGSFITKYFDQLKEGTLPEKDVDFAISILRAYRLNQYVPDVVQYIRTQNDNQERVINGLESLSWFKTSFQKQHIIALCNDILNDPSYSEAVKYQAKRTINIIE